MCFYYIEDHMQNSGTFEGQKKFTWKSHLYLSCTNPFNYRYVLLVTLGVLCIVEWPTNKVIKFNAGDEESEETPKTVRSGYVSYFIYLCFVATCFIACKVSSWQGHKKKFEKFECKDVNRTWCFCPFQFPITCFIIIPNKISMVPCVNTMHKCSFCLVVERHHKALINLKVVNMFKMA